MKSVLVTGGAGFIGSNFIQYFLEEHPDYFIVNLDKLTYAGRLENLEDVKNHPNYKFIKGDICNRELIEYLFLEFNIKAVIHFAAESHVDTSILKPDDFIRTNVLGTFTLLDVAKNFWIEKPFKYKKNYEGCRFHQISTDEVYGTLGETGFFSENTAYAPNSPYSASKASSDMIARSYYHTFGLDVVITNSSNNYGPKQHYEKFIPTIIRKALNEEPIPIYGNGKNIRDWLHVMDNCRAIDLVFHQGKSGELYNIGARNEIRNINIAQIICKILDELKPLKNQKSYKDLISFVEDRPGHDIRYAIDPTKIEALGWKPEHDFKNGLIKTVKWYINKSNPK